MDLMQDVMDQSGLRLRYDEDMTGYYWDVEAYPACPAPEEEPTAGGENQPQAPDTPAEPSEPDAPQEPSSEMPAEPGEETPETSTEPVLQNFRYLGQKDLTFPEFLL